MTPCELCGEALEHDSPRPDRSYLCPGCARKTALELARMAKEKRRSARLARAQGFTRIMFDEFARSYECMDNARKIWRQL